MKHQRLQWLITAVFALLALPLYAQTGHATFSDWSPPVNLAPLVNSAFNEQRAAISRDNLSLYFISDRPGGLGSFDIWVSHRTSVDDPWGAPQDLGPNINTAGYESAPSFSPNGHWLFFGSNRPGGCGGFDIYASHRRDITDDFGWEPAVNLGCAINSPQDDDGPHFSLTTKKRLPFFTSLV
jgi:Tol biopolymer transport system component